MARKCECGCGEDLPPNASAQMRHKPGHRQRKYQRKRDARVREALAATAPAASVKTTASAAPSGRRRRSGRRSPTRYALIPAEQLEQLIAGADVVEAHDRRAAARKGGGKVVAIPARSLPI